MLNWYATCENFAFVFKLQKVVFSDSELFVNLQFVLTCKLLMMVNCLTTCSLCNYYVILLLSTVTFCYVAVNNFLFYLISFFSLFFQGCYSCTKHQHKKINFWYKKSNCLFFFIKKIMVHLFEPVPSLRGPRGAMSPLTTWFFFFKSGLDHFIDLPDNFSVIRIIFQSFFYLSKMFNILIY